MSRYGACSSQTERHPRVLASKRSGHEEGLQWVIEAESGRRRAVGRRGLSGAGARGIRLKSEEEAMLASLVGVTIFGLKFSGTAALVGLAVVIVVVGAVWYLLSRRR